LIAAILLAITLPAKALGIWFDELGEQVVISNSAIEGSNGPKLAYKVLSEFRSEYVLSTVWPNGRRCQVKLGIRGDKDLLSADCGDFHLVRSPSQLESTADRARREWALRTAGILSDMLSEPGYRARLVASLRERLPNASITRSAVVAEGPTVLVVLGGDGFQEIWGLISMGGKSLDLLKEHSEVPLLRDRILPDLWERL
jgi:hypothetical protein